MSVELENKNLNIKTSKKKYYPELDCIRGLAIFLLICFHTDVATYLDLGILPDAFFQRIFASGAVPVFFCLSGLGLTIKYRSSELDIKNFYKERYKNLVPPYIIWTFLIFTAVTLGEVIFISGSGFSIKNILEPYFIINFLVNYIIGMSTGNVYTLWFVYVLFLYYFIFPFIFRLFKNFNFNTRQIIVILVFSLTLFSYFLNGIGISMFFIGYKGEIYRYSSENLSFVIDFTFFLRCIPFFIYFLIGIDIGFNYDELKKMLKENNILKIIICIGAIFSYIFFQVADLVYDIGTLASIKYIFLSTGSIFLFLLIFNQSYDWTKILPEELLIKFNFKEQKDKNINNLQKNNPISYIKNKSVKFWWFTGQYSTGLYFTHRIVMAGVWALLYFTLGLTLWKSFGPDTSRIEAFLYSSLAFILIYIGCIILIKIIRLLPKNEYILGKPRS
ncbi:MAG: acyltransferase family protein [Candidatus Helarchaeota archaeon]